jgi:hypothetical protein
MPLEHKMDAGSIGCWHRTNYVLITYYFTERYTGGLVFKEDADFWRAVAFRLIQSEQFLH